MDRTRVRDYLLGPDHNDGRHKARRWQEVFGITRADTEMLREVLRRVARDGTVVLCRPALDAEDRPQATTWTVQYDYRGPNGSDAVIRANWDISIPGTAPRLTTAIPKRKKPA